MQNNFNIRAEIEQMCLKVLKAAEDRNERIKKQLLKEGMLDEWLGKASTEEKQKALELFINRPELAKEELRKQLNKHLDILNAEERKEALDHWMNKFLFGGRNEH